MTTTRLSDGRWSIPQGTAPKTCKGCGALIYWAETSAGKRMPLNPDGTSHFANCPKAGDFRKKGEKRGT